MLRSTATWRLFAGYGVVLVLAVAGAVRVATTLEVLLVLVAALAACLGLSVLHTRRVERPLKRMVESVAAMAQEDFGRELAVDGQPAIAALDEALRVLASESRERMDTMTTDRNKVVAILGAMVEGVVALDTAERILHMNTAAAAILGTRSPQTEGRRVDEVTRVAEVCDMLRATLRDGESRSGEMRLAQPPRDRWVELKSAPLLDADDAVAGAVVMLNDVTELRRLEAIRREFVANVSHELKTPITAIRGLVETVLDDEEMPADTRRDFVARIKDQSLRLSTLVTDLLTLSRLESGGELRELAPIDLRPSVRDSVTALAGMAEAKRIRVHTDLPEYPVRVLGDVESLRLLINNLFDNAIKYTPAGGEVTLRVGIEDTVARLDVIDNGIGIEPKDQERIFQRFYRVDKARSRELGGTGLGLAIVKHVCFAHGGEVGVQSVPGSGSTFSVRLPLAAVLSASSRSDRPGS